MILLYLLEIFQEISRLNLLILIYCCRQILLVVLKSFSQMMI